MHLCFLPFSVPSTLLVAPWHYCRLLVFLPLWRVLAHLVLIKIPLACKHTHTVTHARTHTQSSTRTGQGPSAGTNHLLKLLWRSWQSARGRHDFGSHSCPHQQSKMFLGVDPWQPLLLQSSFITVKFYKRENKPFFLHFNRLSIQLNQSKQLLREFICFWRHVLNREGTNRPTVILSLQGHNLPETVTYNGKMQPSNTPEPRNIT